MEKQISVENKFTRRIICVNSSRPASRTMSKSGSGTAGVRFVVTWE